MSNSACRHALVLPGEWLEHLARDFPNGIELKAFYDTFLPPLPPAEVQLYTDVLTWWRHVATRAAGAGARARSGLQVVTSQALPPALRGRRDGWAHQEVDRIFQPLRATPPPLSNATFEAAMQHLRGDLAGHHAAREARELAQHADHEA